MKKTLAFLLCLALCLSGLCAYAEEPEREVYSSGDYEYAILEDGTAEITKYTGEAETLIIPETLDGLPVTSIGDGTFSGCDSLKTVIVGRDSYALTYCRENGLPYAYPDANDWLNG
ncbi:MAG: hypothetical protein IKH34_09200 [Oscillospiraceae bacterium]|nr:hypothetical protein [Oscillospiraceae bacterium]